MDTAGSSFRMLPELECIFFNPENVDVEQHLVIQSLKIKPVGVPLCVGDLLESRVVGGAIDYHRSC